MFGGGVPTTKNLPTTSSGLEARGWSMVSKNDKKNCKFTIYIFYHHCLSNV